MRMPMNRKDYPSNWDAIALAMKAEAGYNCQNCHRPCRRSNESKDAFEHRLRAEFPQWLSDLYEAVPVDPTPLLFDISPVDVSPIDTRAALTPTLKPKLKLQRFTATIAHLNPDPWNPDADLVMWCASCHARYDLRQMGRKQMLKRERLGQLRLQGV